MFAPRLIVYISCITKIVNLRETSVSFFVMLVESFFWRQRILWLFSTIFLHFVSETTVDMPFNFPSSLSRLSLSADAKVSEKILNFASYNVQTQTKTRSI